MLNLFITRQQFRQIERGSNLTDSLTGGAGSGDVVKKVVQKVIDRLVIEHLDTLIDNPFDLPVRLTEQPLERDRGFKATILQ